MSADACGFTLVTPFPSIDVFNLTLAPVGRQQMAAVDPQVKRQPSSKVVCRFVVISHTSPRASQARSS
eukprot:44138-Eustigmatos_ZCMA.PRE.1